MRTEKLSLSLLSMLLGLSIIVPVLARDDHHGDMRPAVDIACVQTAVDKRETAIMAAFATFTTTVNSALTTRKNALHAAWAMTDSKARREAIKAAWSAFHNTWKGATKKLHSDRKAAWEQFRKDAKACRATDTGDSEGQDVDAQ